MKVINIAKKIFAIFTVFLLVFSFNFSFNVKAKLNQFNNDGVAFDDFENADSIDMVNCSLARGNGSVVLQYAPQDVIYDHKNKPNDVEGWYHINPSIAPGGDLLQILSLLINPDLLSGEKFDSLTPINQKGDSDYLETVSGLNRFMGFTYYQLHMFKFKIDEDTSRVDFFNFQWCPGPFDEFAFLDEIKIYLWGHGDYISTWNNIDNLEYTEDTITNYSVIYNESADKYISEDGEIHLLIVGKPDPSINGLESTTLSTDYVKVELTFEEGYFSDGYIISDPIDTSVSNFYGWESVVWESSKPTEDTNVKLQILDSEGDLIKSFEGNSDGFVDSPIDLTSLDRSYTSIRLKAIFHSEKFDLTPYLYEWAVLWQTTEGFFDSFNFSFRVGESYGVDIEAGKVGISEFYSEWPIFGKDPANTRSYVGTDVEYKGNKTYWRTELNKDLGGWFRSPVMKDGIVYVGANDNKIYAFNLSISPGDDDARYKPAYKSAPNYEVESGLAVGEKYVIVGTSKLNSNENKIYALNKTDLSFEWEFSPNTNKKICFSSSPTISNDRVYITSWSGRFASNVMLGYLMDKVNIQSISLLGNRLLNDMLFALDINTGNEIWDNPIYLPAASLSTPAVFEGAIFVGCDNLNGPSLFAYDEYSGRLIWNQSVGSIGRASPVVVKGENRNIVIALARDQNLFSFNGTDKVVALDANDGTILWSYTIGNQSTLLRNIELRLFNFSNMRASSPPAATPAVFEDTVYVMASDGTLYAFDLNTGNLKWKFEDQKSVTFNTASPVVVDDSVYLFTRDSYLNELNTEDGSKITSYKLTYEGIDFLGFLYASPIITDGLIVVSILEWLLSGDFYGHLMCFGEHTENRIGDICSVPIHVQKGKWWNKFNAITDKNNENTITFSIVDEDGNTLITGINGTNNDISDIEKNVIYLCAKLNIGNISKPYPFLKSWGISWSIEDEPPVFISGSFRAGNGQGGWVNLDLSKCSIEVKDYGVNGVVSGLDVDTAKFELIYVNPSNEIIKKTFDAETDGKSGDEQLKVIANISKQNLKIKEFKNITFKIKDLAGNQAISEKVTFKLDTVKPISEIKDGFDVSYNSEVLISAEASDDKSGVANIALYYKVNGKSDWKKYGSVASPYIWSFKINKSEYYEFTSIATDNAGNTEDFPEEGDILFLFDMIKPSKPEFEDIYYFSSLPIFANEKSVTFKDDFEIDTIEYRLDFHGLNDWIAISDGVADNTYDKEWSLSQDDWDLLIEDKVYYVYFRVKDTAKNQYETPDEFEALKIVKDISPPIADVYFDIDDYEGSWDDSFTIIALISESVDFDYAVLEYSYSSDNKKWSDWEEYGDEINKSPFRWKFKATEGSGNYRFRIKLYDAAGNYLESPVEIVNIVEFPTVSLSVMVVLIIILFLLSIMVLVKMKKKEEQA